MTFNSFVYFFCFLSSSVGILLHFFDYKSRSRRMNFGQQHHNSEFTGFQRRFLSGYLPCLFADSLQAPYLYFLYQSYGFLESQIAMLYVVGFLTGVVFTLFSVYLIQRTERRMLCLIFVGINSVSCLMKFSDSYAVLMLSRVLDGIASSLLTAPFQEWYVAEHVECYDFPKEWIPITFRKTAIIHGYLAIVAGFTAEFSESASKMTAFPFLLAIPVMMVGGFFITKSWDENRLDPSLHPKFWAQFSRGLRVIAKNPNVFLLSAIQSLFESCIYMFVFLWTPLFLYLKPLIQDRPSFGGIYSCFMASFLLGTLVQRILSRKMAAVSLLNISTAVGFVAMALVVALTYPGTTGVLKFEVVLVVFCTYELAVGLYFPSMQRLQRDILPAEDRAAILGLFRIPLNLIAATGLLILHSREKIYGNWMILILCMVLLALCFMASLLLQGMVKRVGPNVDHFVLQLKPSGDSEDEI